MNLKDIQVAIVGKLSDRLMAKVESTFTAYRLWELADEGAFYTQIAPDIQALVT
ncbi:TPA: 2-hydroxyacid dehydrogenase, partial [Escherichia coli]|nr:2-hydroxyacid dehydrogenase [Escherichia coli]